MADDVNLMSTKLSNNMHSITDVTHAIVVGDFSKQVTPDNQGDFFNLQQDVNHIATTLSTFTRGVVTMSRDIGTEGRFGGQLQFQDIPVEGGWRVRLPKSILSWTIFRGFGSRRRSLTV